MLLTILQDIFYYPIFNLLMFLNWLVHDYALAIILLTLVVRAAMIPLTRKQLKSQRKMMDIQPQIAQLKEQYKGDQQGFAKAQMQLMKENNVSMFGGCLPLLVQLPFLYGLFYALRSGLGGSINQIRHDLYPFMQFTLNHGVPDTYLRWFAWVPPLHPVLNLNAPDPTHILPILAAALTFFSVRMTMGTQRAQQMQQASRSSDPKQAAQQNAQMQTMSMMTYITPLFTLFIGWQYAAGLSLYWVVSTLFGSVQQYIITGWGGIFKGIKPLDDWAKRQDAQREERRLAKRQAAGLTPGITAPTTTSLVRPSLIAPSTNSAKNGKASAQKDGPKSGDWIEQAKAESVPATRKKERPRPFVTLVTPQEATSAADATQSATGAENGAAKSASVTSGTTARSNTGSLPKGSALTNTARTGSQPTKRKVPPRSGSVPKPKGGKK